MKTQTFYDTIAPRYDTRFVDAVSRIENELATMNLPARNVLDLGCGTGLYLEYCQPSVYVGLDISEGMLSVARSKFPTHRFIQGDMSAIPLPDTSVDSVVSLFGSFSYCLTPHRCVEEINRVLRPGGRVVVMALGQRYMTRKSHVAPMLPFWTYTARQLRHLFSPIGQVTVRGVNWQIERLPYRGYARLEHQTISRFFPDACYFLIVEVRKNAQTIVITECLRRGSPTACEAL
jgi:ubiquinone/menaquinone biosynthesis C-methylase UbiE